MMGLWAVELEVASSKLLLAGCSRAVGGCVDLFARTCEGFVAPRLSGVGV
jgi:hypothetical protein